MAWYWQCRYAEEAADWKDTGVVCRAKGKLGFRTRKAAMLAANKHKHDETIIYERKRGKN